MLGIVEETIKAATPHVLGLDAVDELPEADPQASVEFTALFCEIGIPEFRWATIVSFLLLNLYSLIKKGHTFPSLDYSTQSELMERIFAQTNRVAIIFSSLISLPIVNAYYSRLDIKKLLGFDIVAMKEESELRRVTRDGGPLPPKDEAKADIGQGEEVPETGET